MKELLAFLVVLFLSFAAFADPESDCKAVLTSGVPALAGTTSFCAGSRGYFALEDTAKLIPRVVVEHLTKAHDLGCFPRKNNFHAEPGVTTSKPSDYLHSGYDLGHQAPAEDFAWNVDQMSDSFSTANMAPQLGDLNRQGWEKLEENVRAWALERGALDIYTGTILGGTKTIGKGHVVVPTKFYKVVYDAQRGEVLSFIYPQAAVPKTDPLTKYLTTLADVRKQSGVTFPVPSSVHEDNLWPDVTSAWRKAHVCK